jgi:hypothetical protein
MNETAPTGIPCGSKGRGTKLEVDLIKINKALINKDI